MSNTQIAEVLVVSPFTIKAHVSNILTKLNVVTRRSSSLCSSTQIGTPGRITSIIAICASIPSTRPELTLLYSLRIVRLDDFLFPHIADKYQLCAYFRGYGSYQRVVLGADYGFCQDSIQTFRNKK